MADLKSMRFFQSPDHGCSYLEGVDATTIFVDPEQPITTTDYTALSQLGFRRSGPYLYKPNCKSCDACVPVRIPVNAFTETRRYLRIRKKNKDLTTRISEPHDSDQVWRLYEDYINNRHADGDMFPPSRTQLLDFLVKGRPEARFVEYHLEDVLIAVSVMDQLDDSLSAIYTFFDPDHDHRSLGSLAILDLIQRTRALGFRYLYLGYWIAESRKMAYKATFLPQERLTTDGWELITRHS